MFIKKTLYLATHKPIDAMEALPTRITRSM